MICGRWSFLPKRRDDKGEEGLDPDRLVHWHECDQDASYHERGAGDAHQPRCRDAVDAESSEGRGEDASWDDGGVLRCGFERSESANVDQEGDRVVEEDAEAKLDQPSATTDRTAVDRRLKTAGGRIG